MPAWSIRRVHRRRAGVHVMQWCNALVPNITTTLAANTAAETRATPPFAAKPSTTPAGIAATKHHLCKTPRKRGFVRATPAAPRAVAKHDRVTSSAFVDGWAGRRLEVVTDREAELSRAPIDTVSLSESGAERVFQGVEARYRFPVSIAPGAPWRLAIRLAMRREARP